MTSALRNPSEIVVPMSVFADNILSISPDDYPNNDWTLQRQEYDRWYSYYSGAVLNKRVGSEASAPLMYPAKLNITRPAVINHAGVTIGEFDEDTGIVTFGISDKFDTSQEIIDATSKAMSQLWAINNGDGLFMQQAITSQVFGGCFYKVAWTPIRARWPIRYFAVDPRGSYPVWDGSDHNRLVSMDTMFEIPRPTAVARFRVSLPVVSHTPPETVQVHEHWDEGEYFIEIDGKLGQWPDGSEMAGPNPFFDPILNLPIIPYVYIPRVRSGDFYGESLVTSIMGPQDELNNNLAHLDEGLADAMHQIPWVRNRAKGLNDLDGPRSKFRDLGMTQPGHRDPPEIGRLAGAQIEKQHIDLVTRDFVQLQREHINLPDVAWGRTDSSIRSALTLKFMMWPATNVAKHYRKNFATGFKQLNYLALVMAFSKRQASANINGVSSVGIDPVRPEMIEAVLTSHRVHFPPMLPDDRAELINEVVQRIASGTISIETAIRMLDGSEGLTQEIERINKDSDEKQRRAMEVAEHQSKLSVQEKQDNKPPTDRTNRAQAEGGRAKGESS